MGAHPFRKLPAGHVPALDPVALTVIQAHLTLVKASATIGRDWRKEPIASAKSSEEAQAVFCRDQGLCGSGGRTFDMSHLQTGSKAIVNR